MRPTDTERSLEQQNTAVGAGLPPLPDQVTSSRFTFPAHHKQPPASAHTPKQPKKKLPRSVRAVGVMAVVLLVGFSGGYAGAFLQGNTNTETTIEQQRVVLNEQSDLISTIAEEVGESVVSVNTTTTTTVQGRWSSRDVESEAAGTGVILTDDGLVLTNRHVVPTGTTEVSVVLSDGTELDAKVVDRTSEDDSLDVAFLQITDLEGKTLTPAKLGSSSDMRVGDSVIAIGNALGQFQNTVTTGIISGYGRSVQASSGEGSSDVESLEDLFQTDAAINSGNSGGPLVNTSGEVIAINTAVASDAENIGFAIPIDNIKPLIESVEKTGAISRPFLGVVYVSLTDDIAEEYDLSVNRGAYIPSSNDYGETTIVSGSPADKAGLKEGDVITKVDGTEVTATTNLAMLLSKHAVGDTVNLTVNRDGETITLKATLVERPDDEG